METWFKLKTIYFDTNKIINSFQNFFFFFLRINSSQNLICKKITFNLTIILVVTLALKPLTHNVCWSHIRKESIGHSNSKIT